MDTFLIWFSIVLGHPVLGLIDVPLLINNGIQTVINVVASALEMLAKASCAAKGARLLKHMGSFAYLAIACLVQNTAVISDDLYRKKLGICQSRIDDDICWSINCF